MAERGTIEGFGVALQAIELAHNPIVFTDLEGRIVAANSACERLLGCRKGELLGEHLSILYLAEARDDSRRIFQPDTRRGQALRYP